MNIAIFTDFFLPSLGGVQTSIVNQKCALEAAGHTVIVFAPAYGGEEAYVADNGVIRLPSAAFLRFDGHRPFLAFPWRTRRVAKILRQRHIDVIHIQTEFSVGLMGLKLGKMLNLPVVYTSHTLLWRQVELLYKSPRAVTALAMLYYRLYLRRKLPAVDPYGPMDHTEQRWLQAVVGVTLLSDATVTPSAHLAKKLAHPRNMGKISIIPNTTDFDRLPVKPLPATPVFLWVGRFSPEKNPDVFIEAIRQLSKSGAQFKAVMCGSGPQRKACERMAADIPELSLTVVNNYQEMPSMYDSASVLVTTSQGFDNQPMTIAEAMARQRGVVYCDEDLAEDGLVGGAGIYAPLDAVKLAMTLGQLIENRDKLAMMSKRTTTAAKRFKERHYQQAIEQVYLGVIKKRRPPHKL